VYKTSLTHNTSDLAGVQETTNRDPSINTFHQGLQHRDFSDTGHIGEVLNPLDTLSDELSLISIHNIMSGRKPTTKGSDRVMNGAAQSTGQSSTPLNTGSEISTMTSAKSNSSSTVEKTEMLHKSATINGTEGVMKDAHQSTTQPNTTPKTNFQVLPMTGTTKKKKTISSSKHTTAGSANGLGNPVAQSTATALSGISTPGTSSMTNGSNLNFNTTTQATTHNNPLAAQPKYASTLSLASTTTNKPPGPTFKPLKPIHDWVPPRPNITARTEATDAEKAELRAEDTARKAEKKAEAERKEREMEISMGGAKKREEEKRAKDLAERIGSWD
jgi:hypothetical protein